MALGRDDRGDLIQPAIMFAAAHDEHAGGPTDDTAPLVGDSQQVEPNAVGDGDVESQGRHLAAPAGAEPAHDEQAAAAAAELEVQKQVDEWLDKNQFGLLWEAVTVVNLVACYKKPDASMIAEHFVFHTLFIGTARITGALLGYYGLSPAILFNRMISTSRSRALLWYLWCFACITCEVQFDWDAHIRTYCTDPEYPLLCFPLVVCPISLVASSFGYGAVSIVLFPLRAVHSYQYAKDQDDEGAHAPRVFAVPFLLYLAAGTALYCYCLWVAQGDATASMASHTVRTVNGVGRGAKLLLLGALFFYLALTSILRAMRVAVVFVRRRRWGRIWRGLNPHAHIE
jgi:hypothetical protein